MTLNHQMSHQLTAHSQPAPQSSQEGLVEPVSNIQQSPTRAQDSFVPKLGPVDKHTFLRLQQWRNYHLTPQLHRSALNNVHCPTFSIHDMWSHSHCCCYDGEFQSNFAFSKWRRESVNVEIVHKTKTLQTVKSDVTRNCRICTKEPRPHFPTSVRKEEGVPRIQWLAVMSCTCNVLAGCGSSGYTPFGMRVLMRLLRLAENSPPWLFGYFVSTRAGYRVWADKLFWMKEMWDNHEDRR